MNKKTALPSPLFRGFSDEETADMLSSANIRTEDFKKGEVIFFTGDLIHELGIVSTGEVHIENIDLWGNKSILSHVSAGQVFAETYALCGQPMMVDAVAAKDSQILFIDVKNIMQEAPTMQGWRMKFLQNMLQISMQKNLALSNRIFCTSGKTIRARLFTYLSSESIKKGSTSFQIPFDRQQLADYLNLDRSALSKELGKMRDEGLINFHKNNFELLDTLE